MSNISMPIPQSAPPSRSPRQALAQTSQSDLGPSSNIVISSASRALQNNGRLQIFVDPMGVEAQSVELAANSNMNEWGDLGTRKTRIKENVPEMKKMVGSTIKQPGKSKRLPATSASGTAVASNSKISVFRDPVPGLPPPEPSSSSQKLSGSGSGLGLTSSNAFIPLVDERPKVSAVHQPGTPVTKFTPFRDEVSRALTLILVFILFHDFNADVHP